MKVSTCMVQENFEKLLLLMSIKLWSLFCQGLRIEAIISIHNQMNDEYSTVYINAW